MIWSLEPSGGHQPCHQSKRSFDQFFMAKFHEIAPNYRLRNECSVCVFFSSISRQHKFQPADEWIWNCTWWKRNVKNFAVHTIHFGYPFSTVNYTRTKEKIERLNKKKEQKRKKKKFTDWFNQKQETILDDGYERRFHAHTMTSPNISRFGFGCT